MRFTDEYEVEINGSTYFVSVSGRHYSQDNQMIDDIDVCDGLSELVDEDSPDYAEILSDARSREYNVEVHGRDFDRYSEIENLFDDAG